MNIKLCDCCGKNITNHSDGRKFEYGVHLDTMLSGSLKNHYVDNENNSVSGRNTAWEVCNRCYNKIMLSPVQVFHEMREKAQEEGKFKTITL